MLDSFNRDSLDKYRDFGLLLLRVGIGLMFTIVYGLPKVRGGVQMWAGLGGAFNRIIGITFIPTFWGLMATVSEFVGGMCLTVGVLFRPACALMLFTMVIAVTSIIRGGYGFSAASQPFLLGIVLLSLLFTGSGRLTLPKLLTSIRAAR
jgi:putative oxidoreductase